jgi:hypothetical protein
MTSETSGLARRLLAAMAPLIFAGVAAAHAPAPAVVPAADGKSSSASAAAPASKGRKQAEDATLALIDGAARLASAAPGQRGRLLAEVLELARTRRDGLAGIIESEPEAVLRVALPVEARAALPAEATPFLEQEADEEGDIEVLHVDFPDSLDYYQYHLLTARGRLSLNYASNAPVLLTGTRVRVHGVRVGDALALADGATTTAATTAAMPNTLGAQRTLAILVNWSDAPTQPFSVAQAQSVIFSTTSNYDYEASYQQTWLTGDVAGWFTIAATSTTCDYWSIASQAKQKAAAAGYALSNYSRFVYVFPSNACGWWGMGTVGGSPSEAWIHTRYGFVLQVVGHEMGHNLGLYHSHSLDCGSAALAASGCAAAEYGDYFDLMGNGGNTPHYNAFQKERLGWLNAGVSPPITTVTPQAGTRTFTIAPTERARDASPRALKIARSDACTASKDWFYVEARQPVGFDAFVASNPNVLTGVLLHKVTEGNPDSSYLLDLTPATSAWTDPALPAGQSFTDATLGLTITPVSVGSSGATINVTYAGGSCARAAPAVTLTPTGTRWSSAGAGVGYTVTVTNKDGCGCASSAFDVRASAPTGWSATSARTATVAPGASTSTSIVVTSPAAAATGFYTFPLAASNASAPTSSTSASTTIALATASSIALRVATDKSTYVLPAKRNTTMNALITTTVTSSGSGVPGVLATVRVTDARGSVTTLTGTTGATGSVVVSYPMRAKTSPTGTYSVTSSATVGTTAVSSGASFAVQ